MALTRRATQLLLILAFLPALPLLGGGIPAPPTHPTHASPLTQNPTFYGGYRTVEGIYAFLDDVAARYPGLVEKVDIGDSWCKTHPGQCILPTPSGGYDLFALRVTNRATPDPKPVFWFDAGIHSREIAAPEIAMRFVTLLLEGYDSDPDLHWLVDHHDIWVMPLMNPDGYRIVASVGEGEEPYLQRKNADSDDGCDLFPPNPVSHFGVDINRNFPFQWGCCGGSSTEPCSQNYRGPAAGSAEETQAVIAKMRQLIPDQRGPADTDPSPLTASGIYQNLHSFADMNLYPWGWSDGPAPNGADLRNIAAHLSAPDAEPPGNGYRYCQPPECLYIVDGAATDWAYGELGIPSITTELGGGTFTPPYSEVDALWNENRGMLLYMASIARAPYLLTRGPDAALADRAVAAPWGSAAQVALTANSAWTGNTYTSNVTAAEVYVDTPPWAGGTPIPMFLTDGAPDSPTEPFAAYIETTGLTLGRHIVYVRARGAEIYEGHESWGPVSAAWLLVGTPVITLFFPEGTPASREGSGRTSR